MLVLSDETSPRLKRSRLRSRLPGSSSVVLGIGDVEVRDPEKVNAAVEQCVGELGGIDYLMVAQAHACAAKAGVNALSNILSLESRPLGMTSNIIAPGLIDGTEGLQRLSSPTSREAAVRAVPLQRFGLVKDVADATAFLFGDTGNFVNGTCLDVDGGAWRVQGAQMGGRPYPDSLQPSIETTLKSSSRL
ncbi:uncharacterized protein A1O9_00376 [Exophiala aquamarina CBS 119918]|uniref:2,4-dienoyl-CoA reductase [(3E)-enoyl-CoA-producing] n=1 Tax=Exophiala aquamarina CBS 119918 TaxID=1182545 RepID=A0A072PQM6_9EURO|nr:uncharacterized protein A1O9_00376 [Exophiala aquamarina CBS 119918]KEF62404.1 hypothetical protein A1O9_00376 [Exophiala aquamarina CBS 119918]